MISLKRHLSWGLALSLVALLTLQWVVVTYVINTLIENQLAARLEREGESLLAGTEFDVTGTFLVEPKYVSTIYQRPFSGHYYVMFSNNQTYQSRSLWDTDIQINTLKKGEQTRIYANGPEQQPLLLVAHGYQKQGNVMTIAVAENLAPIKHSMARFQMLYAGISLLGLVALLWIQRLIVFNALRPLQQVKESIAKLMSGEQNQITNNGPTEISPLIEEFNRTLQAIQNKSKRSREALGNLAHALKTNLTLLNQIAERPPMDALPEIRTEIYSATDAINHHIARELKKARLIGDMHPMQRVDLKTELAQLTDTLRKIYIDKDIHITVNIAPDAQFYGDREDLLEMLGNVLDNACKWCDSQVFMTVSKNEAIIFTIEDDGPGCAEHMLTTLIQRGFRADESKPGSGLGLAITNDIVNSYGANLTFSTSIPLGGLCVEVKFPLRY